MTFREKLTELAGACREMYPDAPLIHVAEFLERREREPWCIVDVRTEPERAVSQIPGAVSLERLLDSLEGYSDHNVLVYCTLGCRSGMHTLSLRERGLRAHNLWGGVMAWAAAGQPFETPDGSPTRRVHVYAAPWSALPPEYEAVT